MGSNITKKNVISSLFWKLLENGGAQATQIIIQIILARLLSPQEFGTMAIVLVLVNLAEVFINAGFNEALIQKRDSDELDFSSVFYLTIVVAFLFYLIIFIFSPIIADAYSYPSLSYYLRVVGLVLFPGAISSIQISYITKTMQFKKLAISSVLSSVVSGIIGIISAYLGLGIWSLIIQQVLYRFIKTLILWCTVKWRPINTFSYKRVKKIFTYGSNILGANLIYQFYTEIRTLIIGKVYSAESLGFYQRGEQIPRSLVNNINGAIQSVMFPTLSEYQDDIPRIKSIIRRTLRTSSYIIYPMMLGTAATSHTLVYLLLGEQWAPAIPFLIIFSITYSLWPIMTVHQQSIRALGRSDIIFKIELLKRIIGVIIIIVTVQISVRAVAVGFLVERIIETIINAFPNRKLLNYGYIEQSKDIALSILQAVIMGILVFMMNFLEINLILLLFLQIIVGIFSYLGLSILFKNKSLDYVLVTLKGIRK